ncbi:uncharacterized protein VK521_000768 [Ammospiza maritima maritima]
MGVCLIGQESCAVALQKKIPKGQEKCKVKITTKTPQTICRTLQLCPTDSTVVEYKVLNLTGWAFRSRRPSQTFWDSSFIKVEDKVQSVVINAVQELSTEKQWKTDITNKENMVEATRKPKVYESSEALQQRLSFCEEALAVYLESKHMLFSFFCFGFSADLLDIL